MNETQTIFTIFFAIAWGTLSNVLPRWKPFNLPLFGRICQTTCRACLGFVLFNLTPAVLFVLVMRWLRGPALSPMDGSVWTWAFSFSLIWRAVLPGLLPLFGVYRLWIAIIELVPDAFYLKDGNAPEVPEHLHWATVGVTPSEPNQATLNLTPKAGWANLLWGILHISAVLLVLIPA